MLNKKSIEYTFISFAQEKVLQLEEGEASATIERFTRSDKCVNYFNEKNYKDYFEVDEKQ